MHHQKIRHQSTFWYLSLSDSMILCWNAEILHFDWIPYPQPRPRQVTPYDIEFESTLGLLWEWEGWKISREMPMFATKNPGPPFSNRDYTLASLLGGSFPPPLPERESQSPPPSLAYQVILNHGSPDAHVLDALQPRICRVLTFESRKELLSFSTKRR